MTQTWKFFSKENALETGKKKRNRKRLEKTPTKCIVYARRP